MKVYICLQTPHGDFGELGEIFDSEEKATKYCETRDSEDEHDGMAWQWYYEERDLQ